MALQATGARKNLIGSDCSHSIGKDIFFKWHITKLWAYLSFITNFK